MPYVHPVPIGQNVSMIRTQVQRTRAVEAARIANGIAVGGLPYTVASTSFFSPAGWPTVVACIRPSGAAWGMWQLTVNTTAFIIDCGISVDGAFAAVETGSLPLRQPWLQANDHDSGQQALNGFWQGGQTGLTPGSTRSPSKWRGDHNLPGPVTISNPALIIWPL